MLRLRSSLSPEISPGRTLPSPPQNPYHKHSSVFLAHPMGPDSIATNPPSSTTTPSTRTSCTSNTYEQEESEDQRIRESEDQRIRGSKDQRIRGSEHTSRGREVERSRSQEEIERREVERSRRHDKRRQDQGRNPTRKSVPPRTRKRSKSGRVREEQNFRIWRPSESGHF